MTARIDPTDRLEDLLAKNGITPRIYDLLCCYAAGMSIPQIAKHLQISHHTAKTHAQRVLKQLDARHRSHAVAKAIRLGIPLPPEPQPNIPATVHRVAKVTFVLMEEVDSG